MERKFRPLEHFLIQFNIKRFDKGEDELYIEDNKYYLITKKMHGIIRETKKPFYIGNYLGKARGKQFFPSVNFVSMIADKTRHKIWLDDKTEWLFVCGRDIFSEGITKADKCVENNKIVLVLNKNSEVLGFGKVMDLQGKKMAVKNILDIGDFLRRERRIKK